MNRGNETSESFKTTAFLYPATVIDDDHKGPWKYKQQKPAQGLNKLLWNEALTIKNFNIIHYFDAFVNISKAWKTRKNHDPANYSTRKKPKTFSINRNCQAHSNSITVSPTIKSLNESSNLQQAPHHLKALTSKAQQLLIITKRMSGVEFEK